MDGFDVSVALKESSVSVFQQLTYGKQNENALIDGFLTTLASYTRLLVPSEWHAPMYTIRAIDPRRANPQLVCRLNPTRDVPCEHGSREAIGHVVSLLQRILLIFKLDDDGDGA